MDSDFLRKLKQNAPHQPETDWAGRAIPNRMQIERAIFRSQQILSRKEMRRLEKQRRKGIERG